MTVKQEHLSKWKNGKNRWYLKIKPAPKIKQIRQLLKGEAPPNSKGEAPKCIVDEAKQIVAKAVLGLKEELKAHQLRGERYATLGEIMDRYENHPRTAGLEARTRRDNINQMTHIIAMARGIKVTLNEGQKYTNLKCRRKAEYQSPKVAGSKEAAQRRREKVGKLCSSVLTGGLVDKVNKLMWAAGPKLADFEKDLPEFQNEEGELSKASKRRVAQTIKSTLKGARSLFSERGRRMGNLIDSTSGIYCGNKELGLEPLNLPPTLQEFKKQRTHEDLLGKKQYRVPKIKVMSKLWNGMAQFKKETPEAYKLFKLCIETGMRMKELKNCLWDQFDQTLEGMTYTVYDTKNDDERTLPIGQELYDELLAMETDDVYVIGCGKNCKDGKTYRKSKVAREVSLYMRSCGWTRRMCAHEIRKWFGAQLSAESKDLIMVMNALGHRDYSTTKFTYSGITNPLKYESLTKTLPGSASDPQPAEKVA